MDMAICSGFLPRTVEVPRGVDLVCLEEGRFFLTWCLFRIQPSAMRGFPIWQGLRSWCARTLLPAGPGEPIGPLLISSGVRSDGDERQQLVDSNFHLCFAVVSSARPC